jgi:hypothetical protein
MCLNFYRLRAWSLTPPCITVLQTPTLRYHPSIQLEGTLLDETDVSPVAKCHCIVVFEIPSNIQDPQLAQYTETATLELPGWNVVRDPDRFVVIRFHFEEPLCGPDSIPERAQRIQISGAIAS